VPPPEKASPTEVLAYVRANPGGIGYVPAGTALPDGVKALKVTQ
jgi:ABC-type phosphate transport system substrate-binding protein